MDDDTVLCNTTLNSGTGEQPIADAEQSKRAKSWYGEVWNHPLIMYGFNVLDCIPR